VKKEKAIKIHQYQHLEERARHILPKQPQAQTRQ